MAISTLPDAPARSDAPDTFISKADAFVAALATFVTEANALATDINAAASDATAAASGAAAAVAGSDFMATSGSSVSPGTGSKAFTLNESGKSFADDDDVVIFRKGDFLTRMRGTVASVVGLVVTVTVTETAGSGGPYTDWYVASAGFVTAPPAAGSEILTGTEKTLSITPGTLYDALAEVTLTDAATIAVDMATFLNAKVTLGGNRTLGNPTNTKAGQTGRIRFIQDATGNRTLAFGSNWKRAGGAPTLTTTANAIDVIDYDVVSSTYILYTIKKNPS